MSGKINARGTLAERFEAKIERIPFLTCWVWMGSCNKSGYGMIGVTLAVDSVRNKTYRKKAHRVAYELYRGLIPDGFTLDHRCRNTWCVNPWHVEPETHKANILLGDSMPAKNARKTHCLRGHPFDEANTDRWRNDRRCRTCRRAYFIKRHSKMKEKG